MCHTVISKSISTKLFSVSIQYNIIRSCRNQESVISKGSCGIKIKHKYQIATHKSQYLVTIIMPNLLYVRPLEITHTLDNAKHFTVKITQIMIAQIFIVYQIPLSSCVFVAPTITLSRKVYPFRMPKLISHKVKVSAINCSSSY